MSTLRFLLAAPAAPDLPLPWSLFDDAGTCTATGHDAPADCREADRVEIVVAANLVRLASVVLPPLAPARVAAAVAYALEDKLADGGDKPALAASPQRTDGRVVVAIVARFVLASIRAHASAFGPLARVIAEPELASPDPGWCWCMPDAAAEGDGFVRCADGSAFPVSARGNDGPLPADLKLALAQAARDNAAPGTVRVDATVSDAALARWTQDAGIPFVRGAPWHWDAAPPAAYAHATNLLQGEFALADPPRAGERRRLFMPALWLAAAALVFHVVFTLGEWAWFRIDAWRTGRALAALAVSAGVDAAEAATPASARAALARVYAQQRHAHGLPAAGDALPLLARAAPALSIVPPGVLKSATYADGHWTIDLQRVDPQVVRDLETRLRQLGTPAVIASTATGARLRLEPN